MTIPYSYTLTPHLNSHPYISPHTSTFLHPYTPILPHPHPTLLPQHTHSYPYTPTHHTEKSHEDSDRRT